MRTIHYPPIRVSALSPTIHPFAGEAPQLHRLRATSHKAPFRSHLRRACLVAASKSAIPHCARLLWPQTLYFRIHDCLKGHLRRHLFQQVLVNRGPGHVLPARNQPDGARDVQLPRLGAHRRQSNPEQFRGDGAARLSTKLQGPVPDLLAAPGLQTRCQGRRLGIQYAHTRTQFHNQPYPCIWPAASSDADQTLPNPDYTPVVQETRIALDAGNSGAEPFRDVLPRIIAFASDADRARGPYGQDPRWQGHDGKLADYHRPASDASAQGKDVRICCPSDVVDESLRCASDMVALPCRLDCSSNPHPLNSAFACASSPRICNTTRIGLQYLSLSTCIFNHCVRTHVGRSTARLGIGFSALYNVILHPCGETHIHDPFPSRCSVAC